MRTLLLHSFSFLAVFLYLGCGHKGQIPESVLSQEAMKDVYNIPDNAKVDSAYLMGRFEPDQHEDFKIIPEKYADRPGLMLRKETLEAFINMYAAADSAGIQLQIRSATRNFEYQKGIWERKWTGETILSDGTNVATDISDSRAKALKILEYSSMPGTSRHHWGTDIDLNSFSNGWFEKGEGLKLYNWMLDHAERFGFCQPYTPHGSERPHGYFEEKWHWSYIPLSSPFTYQAKELLNDEMITGFAGSETATAIGVIEKYVLGINQNCNQWH